MALIGQQLSPAAVAAQSLRAVVWEVDERGAVLVFVGLLFVITNTLVDVLSLTLDPRISLEGTR